MMSGLDSMSPVLLFLYAVISALLSNFFFLS